MGELHRDAIIIDGLNISRWEPETFRAMHVGGLTAVNCTCCVWEGFVETMEAGLGAPCPRSPWCSLSAR